MSNNPLEQFKITELFQIQLFNLSISVTNSALYMILAVLIIVIFFSYAFRKNSLLPTRTQASGELIYSLIHDMLEQNIGSYTQRFLPLIMSLFLFILTCNLLGNLPYGFTVTSHISITFTLAMLIFGISTITGFYINGYRFLAIFLPSGTPWYLAPLMIVIEFFAYLAKPVSLSLRLAANMIAGHILLKVIAGFGVSLIIYLKFVPVPVLAVLIGFEIFISILQAYIFTILSCLYLNNAINLH